MKSPQFNKIYDQYYLLVMKVAYNVLQDYHYAQDICQEVFIVLYKKRDNIDEALAKPWLLVNTKRKAIDFQRKKFYGREVCEESHDLQKKAEKTPEDRVLHQEFKSRLFLELKTRDEAWFEIIMRVVIEEQEPAQVARDMNISIANLRIKMHRARAWIRDNFENDYKEL